MHFLGTDLTLKKGPGEAEGRLRNMKEKGPNLAKARTWQDMGVKMTWRFFSQRSSWHILISGSASFCAHLSQEPIQGSSVLSGAGLWAQMLVVDKGLGL